MEHSKYYYDYTRNMSHKEAQEYNANMTQDTTGVEYVKYDCENCTEKCSDCECDCCKNCEIKE